MVDRKWIARMRGATLKLAQPERREAPNQHRVLGQQADASERTEREPPFPRSSLNQVHEHESTRRPQDWLHHRDAQNLPHPLERRRDDHGKTRDQGRERTATELPNELSRQQHG